MAFKENIVIPEWIAIGAQGGRKWNTDLVVTRGGQHSGNKNWPTPLGAWEFSLLNRSAQEMLQVASMVHVLNGSFHSCRFLDPLDHVVRNLPMLRLTSTTFQIRERFSFGGDTFGLTVTKPVPNDPTRRVTLGGVSTTGYSINTATGIVTFTSEVPTNVAPRYTGAYHIPVYLMTEHLDVTYEEPPFYSWSGIRIVEDRL